MNCKECHKKVEVFVKGSLPEDELRLVREHLLECRSCNDAFVALAIVEKVVAKEQQLNVNPFLKTRIMANINSLPLTQPNEAFQLARNWKLHPVLVAASVIVTIFLGVAAGNLIAPINNQDPIPEELTYLNDAILESLPVLMID